ncbi:sensor histidine kinase [Nocardioides solisilvae]|uniref:sensor histidine kinase n=1 Tax=Nocardioides solisilvae TaxID=1542435 RepID=UPI0013A54639|nr:sensor histidine kinase [Nocardioides solisilvae]
MSPPAATPLSTRVALTLAVLLGLGAAALALTPAHVSPRTRASELAVLAAGALLLVAAGTWLVRRVLAPLDRLPAQLDHARSSEPLERLPTTAPGLAGRLAHSVNDLLDRIEESRRENAVAALAAQEAERSRIAQNLHDGVGQSLTAVLLELTALGADAPPELQDRLERLREGVRASLDEVRSVARHLRPHVLEDLGLRSALAALTNDLFGTGDVLVRRGVLPGLPPLGDELELVVFRVAQEALTNVARHAEARTVEMHLGLQGDLLELTVADDGRGTAGRAEGVGTRGMRERAALVGGTLEVAARDGGGTRVTLRVPLPSRTEPTP